jgi:SAM-dependent methyltransferase
VVGGGRVTLRRMDPIGARRFEIYDALLGRFQPGRLVDLGAGHGKFSMHAADKGWSVTAIDARAERFPDDARVTWMTKDIRTADLSTFDMIVCLGLFYHLTLDDQIGLLRRCSGRPLIIDTHVDSGQPTQPLSERQFFGEYEGRLFYEEQQYATASWENEHSFWPTTECFYKMLNDAGYSVVLASEPWYQSDRTFWLALPGP